MTLDPTYAPPGYRAVESKDGLCLGCAFYVGEDICPRETAREWMG